MLAGEPVIYRAPVSYDWVELDSQPLKIEKLELSKPVVATSTPEIAYDPVACSCVRYAHKLNPKIPLVDSEWFKSFKSGVPVVGGIVIFKYPKNYHIATITKFEADGFWVAEANFKACEIGKRFIEFTDKRIIGFWNP